jgi:hypothetical protein
MAADRVRAVALDDGIAVFGRSVMILLVGIS